jgi:hypothetical protein
MTRLFGAAALVAALVVSTPPCRADIIRYVATLTGPGESPPNSSPATGFAEVDVNTLAQTLQVDVTFSGLLGTTTASHIHSPTALPFTGTANVATTVPTFPGFPLGVTSGTYDQTFDLTLASSYNPAFVTANGGSVPNAEAALLASLAAGTSYLNIHSTFRPGGEIRGFLVPLAATIPEPSTLALFTVGAAAVVGWRRWKRRHERTTA